MQADTKPICEVQFWDASCLAVFGISMFPYLPRVGEHVGFFDKEFGVTNVIHYVGDTQLNKPHIRVYLKAVR